MVKVVAPFNASEARGSVGSDTYSRNQYGQYVRNRTTPVQPDTALQVAARNRFGATHNTWANQLTEQERQAWTQYARSKPVVDTMGRSQTLSGIQMYFRATQPRRGSGLSNLIGGPPQIIADDAHDPVASIPIVNALSSFVSLDFDDARSWVQEDGAGLIVHLGKPVPGTRNFFRGPWQRVAVLAGSSSSPLTSPQAFSYGSTTYSVAVGQRVWWRFQIVRADRRISTPWQTGPVTVT